MENTLTKTDLDVLGYASLHQLRHTIAEEHFDSYDFSKDGETLESYNGWRDDGEDYFSRVIFIANPNGQTSSKALFHVEFESDSVLVKSTYVDYNC